MTDLTRDLDDLNSVEKFYDKLVMVLRERGIEFDVMNHHDDELVEILDIGTAEEIVEELGIPKKLLEIHHDENYVEPDEDVDVDSPDYVEPNEDNEGDYAIIRLSTLDSV